MSFILKISFPKNIKAETIRITMFKFITKFPAIKLSGKSAMRVLKNLDLKSNSDVFKNISNILSLLFDNF